MKLNWSCNYLKIWWAILLILIFVQVPILGFLVFGFWGFFKLYGDHLLSWIDHWQSLIGALVSTALAIGLFQYQRFIDRKNHRKLQIFATIRALKRVRWHFENVKIEFAKSTIERVLGHTRVSGSRGHRPGNDDQQSTCLCIEDVIMLYGKYGDLLSSIPRDQEVAADIIDMIDNVESKVEKTAFDLETLLKKLRISSEWNERNEDQEPVVLVNAKKLLEDVSDVRSYVQSSLNDLQAQYE